MKQSLFSLRLLGLNLVVTVSAPSCRVASDAKGCPLRENPLTAMLTVDGVDSGEEPDQTGSQGSLVGTPGQTTILVVGCRVNIPFREDHRKSRCDSTRRRGQSGTHAHPHRQFVVPGEFG
ncbi:hypothetical protein B0J11DRAFT_523306 [Dendryphion nanum]|uniref:Uncharacterized protein n=1 Tax=Dendryphion nanum TaxID=256645 RepID=A0A9P9E3T0_9PLEO|nr:hypothetical protein B0J11DRAFT_523306 [Dendryphion nanum]